MGRGVLLVAASLCLLLPLVFVGVELLAVDRCLDAGGSFDYASARCDFERSHPSAWLSRPLRPLVGGGVALALAFVAAQRMQRRLDRGARP